MVTNQDHLTPNEVAQILCIATETVRHMCITKRLDGRKQGKGYLITAQSVRDMALTMGVDSEHLERFLPSETSAMPQAPKGPRPVFWGRGAGGRCQKCNSRRVMGECLACGWGNP